MDNIEQMQELVPVNKMTNNGSFVTVLKLSDYEYCDITLKYFATPKSVCTYILKHFKIALQDLKVSNCEELLFHLQRNAEFSFRVRITDLLFTNVHNFRSRDSLQSFLTIPIFVKPTEGIKGLYVVVKAARSMKTSCPYCLKVVSEEEHSCVNMPENWKEVFRIYGFPLNQHFCELKVKPIDAFPGIVVRNTFDLESITLSEFEGGHNAQKAIPILVCFSLDIFLFYSTELKTMSDEHVAVFNRKIDEIVEELEIPVCQSQLEQKVWYILINPSDFQSQIERELNCHSVLVKFARFQKKLKDLFLEDQEVVQICQFYLKDIRQQMLLQLPENVSKESLCEAKVYVVSSSFNGHKFDEILLYPYRQFITEGENNLVEKFDLAIFNGGMQRCSSSKTVKSSNRTKLYNVEFLLFDLVRFWVSNLRSIAQSLQLPQQKGEMNFALLNNIYNATALCKSVLSRDEMLSIYGFSVDDFENFQMSLKKRDENWDEEINGYDIMYLLVEYCAADVIVTNLATDKLILTFRHFTEVLLGPKVLNLYCITGTPSACQFIWRNLFLTKHSADKLQCPQGPFYDFIRSAIFGGRSEISVIGNVENEKMNLLDINSMYGVAQKAEFPIGLPVYMTFWEFDRLDSFLEWARHDGIKIDVRASYEKRSTDFGWSICTFDIRAGDDMQFKFPIIPIRKDGKLVYSIESRVQRLTNVDAELMARCGYTVKCVRSEIGIYWQEGDKVFKDMVVCFTETKKEAERVCPEEGKVKNPALVTMSKLLSNANYGKQMQNIVDNFLSVNSNDYNELSLRMSLPDLETTLKRKQELKNKSLKQEQKFELLLKQNLKNPYKMVDGQLDMDSTLSVNKVKRLVNLNTTVTQNGAFILSYSRWMFIDMVSKLWLDPKIGDYELSPYFAAETDSMHFSSQLTLFDRSDIAAEFISTEVGDWDDEKKNFHWFVKYETFKNGKDVTQANAVYLGKKFYLCWDAEDSQVVKGASKGIRKSKLNVDIVLDCCRYFTVVAAEPGALPILNLVSSDKAERFNVVADGVFVKSIPGIRTSSELGEVHIINIAKKIRPVITDKWLEVPDNFVLGKTSLAEVGFMHLRPFSDQLPYPLKSKTNSLQKKDVAILDFFYNEFDTLCCHPLLNFEFSADHKTPPILSRLEEILQNSSSVKKQKDFEDGAAQFCDDEIAADYSSDCE